MDAAGNWYVADFTGIRVFAPGAQSPQATIDFTSAQAVAVAPPLEITTPRLPTAALGRRYRQPIGVVLGRRPLHWRLVRGRLPGGLKLEHGGIIGGVPSQLGTFRFTVTVRKSSRDHMKARQRITLGVIRAPTVTGVRPHSGSAKGGRRITVTGTGFALGRGHTTVTFGRLNAIAVVCHSHVRCTARTPPHAPRTVPVTVTVDGVRSESRPAIDYRYLR